MRIDSESAVSRHQTIDLGRDLGGSHRAEREHVCQHFLLPHLVRDELRLIIKHMAQVI